MTTADAVGTLYAKQLYGHTLIVIYSAIDTMGLLDAPPAQTSATSESFKNWTTKYLLSDQRIAFNVEDLWGARCAVLHTFSSQSDHSENGKAKELSYYLAHRGSAAEMEHLRSMKSSDGGKYLHIRLDDFVEIFYLASQKFAHDLAANCHKNSNYYHRFLNTLEVRAVEVA
jgi:hypothetical protein